MPNSQDDDEADLTRESGPERTCIVTRQKQSPDVMIRFVLSPDGVVVPDIRRKLPGRGVWVTARAADVATAVKKQGFARAFKAKVTVPAGMADAVDKLLETDALQSLSIANKAGVVLTGFVKVSAALEAGPLLAIFHASDASPEGARKLGQAVRRQGDLAARAQELNIFTSLQMDLALGRANVIHAAVKDTAAGAAFLVRALRLLKYRDQTGEKAGKMPDSPVVSTETGQQDD